MHPRYLLALSLTYLPAMLSGQVPDPAHSLGRLTVTGYFGSTSLGASTGLEEAMRANGYTDPFLERRCSPAPSPTPCTAEVPGPRSSTAGSRIHLSVRYRLRAPFAAELLVGQATAGKAGGNRDGERLSVHYNATMIAPLASAEAMLLRLNGRPVMLQSGVGPALLRTQWEYFPDGFQNAERTTTSSIGAVGSLTAVVPVFRSLHLDVSGQYRWFGSAEVPPPSWSASDRNAQVSRSHGYMGLGLGVTF